MTDFNIETEKNLSELPCTVVFQYPESFTDVPCVSFYTLTENVAMRADNKELIQEGNVQIDIWAQKPSQCGELAITVNQLMENSGWLRQFSMDVKRESSENIYHRTMRFAKTFTNPD